MADITEKAKCKVSLSIKVKYEVGSVGAFWLHEGRSASFGPQYIECEASSVW